jgi:hypothetical protein
MIATLVSLVLAQAPPTLPLGGSVRGTVDGGVSEWVVDVREAGMLAVAARADDDADLVLEVMDVDGQPLPEGYMDGDHGGSRGAEQVVVAIPWAGRYRVQVRELSDGAGAFELGAGFFAMRSVARREPAHARPGTALHLDPGQGAAGVVDGPEGAAWQWFRLSPRFPGTLVIEVKATVGDLVLEAYRPPDFKAIWEASDQDLEGVLGNERLALPVGAGETVFLRVRDRDPAGRVDYQLGTRLEVR